MKPEAANIITGFRILCSIALLFCPTFSLSFIALYVIAGITDMIDGMVARKTNTVSEFGAKLDTAADFAFVAVCLWKLLPKFSIPLWLWLWIAGIALIKAVNLLSGYRRHKRFVVMHTVMNKVTGILLFIFPLTLPVVELKSSAPFICAIATFAAVQEGHCIRIGREIQENGSPRRAAKCFRWPMDNPHPRRRAGHRDHAIAGVRPVRAFQHLFSGNFPCSAGHVSAERRVSSAKATKGKDNGIQKNDEHEGCSA